MQVSTQTRWMSVVHSTGGLVARVYIESDAYNGLYDGSHHLPKINNLIMIGVPNRGASKAWNPLHDNWYSDDAFRVVLSRIVSRAYTKVQQGQTISGPDGSITLQSIQGPGPDPHVNSSKPTCLLREGCWQHSPSST